MTNKELKNLARQIAKLEKKIRKSSGKERAKFQNEIMELASQLTLNDMIFIDECIRHNWLD